MEAFKRMGIASLQDADPSIKFCKRVKSLITAMNSRTPLDSLRPNNVHWKVSF